MKEDGIGGFEAQPDYPLTLEWVRRRGSARVPAHAHAGRSAGEWLQ